VDRIDFRRDRKEKMPKKTKSPEIERPTLGRVVLVCDTRMGDLIGPGAVVEVREGREGIGVAVFSLGLSRVSDPHVPVDVRGFENLVHWKKAQTEGDSFGWAWPMEWEQMRARGFI